MSFEIPVGVTTEKELTALIEDHIEKTVAKLDAVKPTNIHTREGHLLIDEAIRAFEE